MHTLRLVPPEHSPDDCAQPRELVWMLEAIEDRVVMLAENGRLDGEAAIELLAMLDGVAGELS